MVHGAANRLYPLSTGSLNRHLIVERMRSNLFLRISMSAENVETGNNWRYIEVGTMNLYYPAAPPPVVSSYPLNGPICGPTPHARRCCSGISHSPPLRTANTRGLCHFHDRRATIGRGGYSFQPAKRIPNQVIIGRCKYSVARNRIYIRIRYITFLLASIVFFSFPQELRQEWRPRWQTRAENFPAKTFPSTISLYLFRFFLYTCR